MFCPNCGAQNTSEAIHCTSCGCRLRTESIATGLQQPSLAEMRDWLRDVLEAERRLVVLENTRTELRRRSSQLGRIKEVPPPVQVEAPNRTGHTLGCAILIILPVYIIVFAIFAFLQPVNVFQSTSKAMPEIIWHFGVSLLVTIPICICLGWILSIRGYKKDVVQTKDENDQAIAKWQHDEAVRQAELSRQLKIRAEINREYRYLGDVSQSVGSKRDELYSTDYLAPDYRSLVPVAVMYGYITTGRCTTIYGHGGIIDTYVHDQQFALLNSKLDTIIDQLDSIRDTQTELARALERNQEETSRLRSDIAIYADRQHTDAVQIAECVNYGNDCLTWIKGVALYGSPFNAG